MKNVAVLTADLHLSLKQPPCRKDDWMEVQKGYLKQLRGIAGKLPILCAGDIFDKWNPPPELIQFALRHLPDGMICVPGQHDLPNHRMEEMTRSAYGVLVEAGKIQCASSHRRAEVPSRSAIYLGDSDWKVYGFGWNEDITPPVSMDRGEGKNLALVHKYVWTIETSFGPGTPQESHIHKIMPALKPYRVAVFGDNHKGFQLKLKTGTNVLNCGGFIRRKSDEIDYRPTVGILRDDGSIVRQPLITDRDQFRTDKEMEEVVEVDMSGFVEELSNLGEHGLDFRETVRMAMKNKKVPGPVKEMVLSCLT